MIVVSPQQLHDFHLVEGVPCPACGTLLEGECPEIEARRLQAPDVTAEDLRRMFDSAAGQTVEAEVVRPALPPRSDI